MKKIKIIKKIRGENLRLWCLSEAEGSEERQSKD